MKDLKLRNTLLLQLVENAQDGIVIAEREGNDTILIYVNPAFEKLTGYTSEEILYQDCRFLQGDDTEQQSVKDIRTAIEAELPVRRVLKNYRKDGSVFWNELSVTPYYDPQERLTYYIGIQKNVTQTVKLNEALAKAEQEIEALKSK